DVVRLRALARLEQQRALLEFAAGHFAVAEQASRQALGIWQRLERARPQDRQAGLDLLEGYRWLGLLLVAGGEVREAARALEEAETLAQRLLERQPRDENLLAFLEQLRRQRKLLPPLP